MIVQLEPYEIEMASQVANKRYIENIKMKKKFGHGYKGSEQKTLSLGILGAMGEVAYCKAKNVFFNGRFFGPLIVGSHTSNSVCKTGRFVKNSRSTEGTRLWN